MESIGCEEEITGQVREFYNLLPFPGRLVRVFNLPEGIRKNFVLLLAKKTLFHSSNVRRVRMLYGKIIKEPKKIFDAACGTGELACLLARAFPEAEIKACDLSNINLDYANRLKKFLGINNCKFFYYDLTSSERLEPYENDLVVCSGAIHHLSEPVKGLRRLASVLSPRGRVLFGVYGKSYFREEYLTDSLRIILSTYSHREKLAFLKEFNIRRQPLIRDLKRENRLLKYLEILKGDFSYLGYDLFPHNEGSLQMDGFCHPNVKYYNPDTLFDDVEAAGLEIERFFNLEFPEAWVKNAFFNALPLKEKFRLLDAYKLVPYLPICKLKSV
jgi:SAM-dependent methyltransferase